jgi:hypothetical protein
MKKNSCIKRRWLWLWSLTLACQLLPNKVQASDRSGIPLIEVADLVIGPAPLTGKRIAVLAEVLCLDQLHCVLGDEVSTQRAIEIDTRRMRLEDRRRLARKCFYIACSEILIGAFTRGTFTAIAAYETGLPLPPPKAVRPRILASGLEQGPATPQCILTWSPKFRQGGLSSIYS